MSRDVRKPVFGVSDQVWHNKAVQSQKMTRGLKFESRKKRDYMAPYVVRSKQFVGGIFVHSNVSNLLTYFERHHVCASQVTEIGKQLALRKEKRKLCVGRLPNFM